MRQAGPDVKDNLALTTCNECGPGDRSPGPSCSLPGALRRSS